MVPSSGQQYLVVYRKFRIEHNYGHGCRNLATMLVLLMLLAFLIDQIQQLSGGLFSRIWKKLGTKTKLWAMMRSLFSVLVFDSMKALYRFYNGRGEGI